MQSLKYYFEHPKIFWNIILYRFGGWIPDKWYLKLKFRLWMGKKLDLDSPKSYSEKLQWLKLYDRRPEYTLMVDKVKAKEYVASVLGSEYVIPTFGVWDDPENIDFSSLPDRFVLKCNHNSGLGMYICKNKSKMDISKIKADLRKGLKQNFYLGGREWPYKNVQRRILAEEYIEPQNMTNVDIPDNQLDVDLLDYKFFCFNGIVRALFIATGRNKGPHETRFDFYDESFNHLPFTNGHPNADKRPQKPYRFDEMKALAEKLSQGIPHVRVDFYEVNNRIYFGEMTFFHWSGFKPFVPEDWDYKFGSWLELPEKRSGKLHHKLDNNA